MVGDRSAPKPRWHLDVLDPGEITSKRQGAGTSRTRQARQARCALRALVTRCALRALVTRSGLRALRTHRARHPSRPRCSPRPVLPDGASDDCGDARAYERGCSRDCDNDEPRAAPSGIGGGGRHLGLGVGFVRHGAHLRLARVVQRGLLPSPRLAPATTALYTKSVPGVGAAAVEAAANALG